MFAGNLREHKMGIIRKTQDSSDSLHSWNEILPSMISLKAMSSGSSFSNDSTNGLLPGFSCLDLLDITLMRVFGSLMIA